MNESDFVFMLAISFIVIVVYFSSRMLSEIIRVMKDLKKEGKND